MNDLFIRFFSIRLLQVHLFVERNIEISMESNDFSSLRAILFTSDRIHFLLKMV